MLIDCSTCVARDVACDGCVVRVLLDSPAPRQAPDARVELDADERAAIGTLAAAGLVPPLRLVQPVSSAENVAPACGGESPGRRRTASRGIA